MRWHIFAYSSSWSIPLLLVLNNDNACSQSTSSLSLGTLPSSVGEIYNPTHAYTDLGIGQYILTGSIVGAVAPPSGWPVVIAYHGGGEDSETLMEYSDMGKLSCVVIAPLGQPSDNIRSWLNAFPWLHNPPRNDAAFTNAILQDVAKLFPLDMSRIYVTGKSDGGGMASFAVRNRYLLTFNIRGVCIVSGAFFGITNIFGYSEYSFPASAQNYMPIGIPATPIPILDLHGTSDTVMPYHGQFFNVVKATEGFDQPGRFWGNAQGFLTKDAYTADLPALYSAWSGGPNQTAQNPESQRFTYSVTEQAFLYEWSSPNLARVQHVEVVGGEHCWYGHPTPENNCSSGPNLQVDATYILAQYFQIPLHSSYKSPTSSVSPTAPYAANPSGLIDLSCQGTVSPQSSNVTVSVKLSSDFHFYDTASPSSWAIGLFEVLNFQGQVTDASGTVFSPGNPNWLKVALGFENVAWLLRLESSNQDISFSLPGGKIYSSFISQAPRDGPQDLCVSTPFQNSCQDIALQVIDLGVSSFAFEITAAGGSTGNRTVFSIQNITLV